jgi:hypothetical protein
MVITGGTRRMSVLAAITQAADIADTVTSLKKKRDSQSSLPQEK